MKNLQKQKYVPCKVNVIKFNVEQEFANTSNSFIGSVATSKNTLTLTQKRQNGDFENEQYNQEIDWFDFGKK